ncbi:MAG: cytochrome c biogenesis protein [Verrucomicrobia bacterium]|nr:cytochrome c biogenesis protein [Verrucomicrobiota bacterium]
MNLDEHGMMMIATLIYGLALVYSVFLWRKGFTRDDTINVGFLVSGFLCHTIALMIRAAETQRCPINNLFEVTMFTAWIIGFGFIIGAFWSNLRSFGVFISPLVFSLSLMSLFPNVDSPVNSLELRGWFILHVPIILLAYGSFAMASVASVMYLTHSHYLKYNKELAFWVRLPSISRLEHTSIILLNAGVALLTIGLALGFFILKINSGKIMSADAKIYWSLVVWVGYVIVLLLHWFSRIRGRYFACLTLGMFLFVLTTFWGANLLSDIHNASPVP